VELGRHTEHWIRGRDLVVTSPGIPAGSPPLQWAKKDGIPILSEIELASFFCRGRIIAVTGSNGKSTTTSLLGMMFEKAKKRAWVCGNIGNAFSRVAAQVTSDDWVILEVSSFQLEYCRTFRPHLALILNVSPNHLDRHEGFEEYLLAKRRIARAQTEKDCLLLNADDPFVRHLGRNLLTQKYFFSRKEEVEGVILKGKGIYSTRVRPAERLCTLEGFNLPGFHNEENALAAVLAAHTAGVPNAANQKALVGFSGLPHRIESVGTWEEVRYINDSKSTTVSSALRALETFPAPIVRIAGGREKLEDFTNFSRTPLLKKVERMFRYGEAKEKILSSVAGRVAALPAGSFEEAVLLACHHARPGVTVLLSPMCTSFDCFRDFEERGERFKETIRAYFRKKVPSLRGKADAD
jgi:UDP-N-acetylmuramoylalanine--D-glutamate ligase